MYELGFSDGLPLLPQRDRDDSNARVFTCDFEPQCRDARLALEFRSVGHWRLLVIKRQEPKDAIPIIPRRKRIQLRIAGLFLFSDRGTTLAFCSDFIGRTATVLKDRLCSDKRK